MLNDIHPSHFDTRYLHHQTVAADDYLLCYRDNQVLLKKTGDELGIPRHNDIPGVVESPIYLFSINGHRCFGINADVKEPNGCEYHDIFVLRTLPHKELAWMGAVGHQLVTWYVHNRFCGRCGHTTELKSDERAIVCPHCQLTIYPKLSPAIIVAITCGNKLLLAKGKNYRGDFYALIAGYVDVGESIEETVAREVKEEIGIDIKNLRYVKSQPWPFSASLMLGFTAEGDDTQPIVIDEKEIHEAGWFERGNLPPHATGVSISGYLIDQFDKGLI